MYDKKLKMCEHITYFQGKDPILIKQTQRTVIVTPRNVALSVIALDLFKHTCKETVYAIQFVLCCALFDQKVIIDTPIPFRGCSAIKDWDPRLTGPSIARMQSYIREGETYSLRRTYCLPRSIGEIVRPSVPSTSDPSTYRRPPSDPSTSNHRQLEVHTSAFAEYYELVVRDGEFDVATQREILKLWNKLRTNYSSFRQFFETEFLCSRFKSIN
ncbi:22991_t:CDS:2 [Dentiscutata erythropus]|uniref:22991_t:CDS:1 n=1 Tax=Dentiscutata erythropus TaxID=1348616 RepID=A0A9N9DUJ4_9GLOM|nr:22991_t:CDS:2 [Dentiscutata erythropus]